MKKSSLLIRLIACQLTVLLAVTVSQAVALAPQHEGSREPSALSASLPSAASGVQADPVSALDGPVYAGDVPESPETTADEENGPEAEAAPAPTLEDIRTVTFPDVSPQDCRADYISYTAYSGVLPGISEEAFDPDGFATCAELAAALYRMNGASSGMSVEELYDTALAWALQDGIFSVPESGAFNPSARVTREELAVFLHRFAASSDSQTYDSSLSAYQDGASVQEYARPAMAWALENRLYGGMAADTIHPALPVSRGQLAQVLVALTAYCTQEPLAQELADQLHTEAVESASAARHSEIQEQVDAIAAKYGATGLQVAVIESGQVTDSYTYGWAIKGSEPMTSEHKLRNASITKVGVGLAAMILYEDGVIDLDESIGTYWGFTVQNPSHPDIPVNIRSLLSHTSSIPVLDDDTSRTRASVEARLRSGGFTRGVPGDIGYWNYNNYAFGVLGMTLEVASGRLLDDIVGERIWSILDVDIAFESGNIKNTDLLATVYTVGGGVGRSAASMAENTGLSTPGASGAYFAGGMTSSAVDLAKMIAVLANDGCYEGLQLLRADTVELMEQRYDRQLPDGSYQALPMRAQDDIYGRSHLYYHTGSAYGVFNCVSYDPDTGDGVVVLTSGASGVKDSRGIYSVCGEISAYIYETIA